MTYQGKTLEPVYMNEKALSTLLSYARIYIKIDDCGL